MNQIKKYSNKENVGLGSGHRVVIVTLCLIPSQMKKKKYRNTRQEKQVWALSAQFQETTLVTLGRNVIEVKQYNKK